MGYDVVDHVALNSKWIAVTLYGILNPTNGSMLPLDFAWGKVVLFHCFASNITELVLCIPVPGRTVLEQPKIIIVLHWGCWRSQPDQHETS